MRYLHRIFTGPLRSHHVSHLWEAIGIGQLLAGSPRLALRSFLEWAWVKGPNRDAIGLPSWIGFDLTCTLWEGVCSRLAADRTPPAFLHVFAFQLMLRWGMGVGWGGVEWGMLTCAGTYVMKLMLRWGWGWGGAC